MEQLKVLVIDDEILVRRSVAKLLRREKLSVFEAEDGYRAIEMAKEEEFQIVVSDIRMPGLNGIETIKAIKEIQPNIRSIVMTGFASENTPIEAIRIGVNDYIYKPFELEEFRYCIQRNLKLIELERQNKELEEENIKNHKLAAIGMMTNTIVHDVKNALTTIIGFTKLIKGQKIEKNKQEKFLDIIIQQTILIQEKLKEILEFARGDIGTELRTFYIKDIYKLIVDENLELLEADEINFVRSISDDLENTKVKIDSKRIKQVFFNLIANSKDALGEKDDRIISLDLKKDGDFIIINLKDNGAGISKEHLKHIFEPFASYGKQYGTGLGLAIVSQIVEKSHGKIQVESIEGEWTEFTISLPIYIENANEAGGENEKD